MTDLTTAPLPLTTLSDEEETVPETRSASSPRPRSGPTCTRWTRPRQFRPDLIPKFFELGLMGIEMPEQFGGAGGNIFLAVLAIEELARVDASAAIYVDVHNTLVNNALLRWGSDEQQPRYFPRLTTELLGAFALSEPASGSDAFALETQGGAQGRPLGADRPQVLDHQRRRGGALHRVRQHRSRRRATRGSPRSSSSGISPGFTVGKKEDKLGIRASSTTELILEKCVVPDRERARAGRPGLQDRDRDAERGPHRHRRADDRRGAGRARGGHRVRQGAEAVRQGRSPSSRASSSSSPRWPPNSRPRG